MKIFDMVVMCVRNLTRRKFRTILTVVGVVIGTCMIVVMVSLGEGMSRQLDETFNNFGDLTTISVYTMWTSSGQENSLDDAALTAISQIEGVDAVTPFEYPNLNMQMFVGKKDRYQSWMSICGVYPEALAKMGYGVTDGTMLEASNGKDINLLFGAEVAYYFEDTKRRGPDAYRWQTDDEGNPQDPFFNPLEETVTLHMSSWSDSKASDVDVEANVVGILRSGGDREWRTRTYVYMDVRDLKRLQQEYNKANGIKEDKNATDSYNDVTVKATTIDDVIRVEEEIVAMGYGTYSNASERESAMESIRRFQMIFGAIGAVSLLIATISIANTMIMSVYERTREIGVMKVLGCIVGNIRTVFLIEAGLIGFFGGLVGIGLSYLLSFLINTFGNQLLGGEGFGGLLGGSMGYYLRGDEASQLSIITPDLVVLGLLFSTLIGICAGFYPAQRAVRISALEAIKQE